jgi:hypothetical protein
MHLNCEGRRRKSRQGGNRGEYRDRVSELHSYGDLKNHSAVRYCDHGEQSDRNATQAS